MPEEWLAVNRALWDERVPIHVASAFYDVDAFLAGGSTLRSFEVEEMGEFLHEHDHTPFAVWPFLERAADGTYRLPEGTPSLPLMYSLLATRRVTA